MTTKIICTCGTPFKSLQALNVHRGMDVWHKVARTARALRKHGLSYREVARQVGLNVMTVWTALKQEGL